MTSFEILLWPYNNKACFQSNTHVPTIILEPFIQILKNLMDIKHDILSGVSNLCHFSDLYLGCICACGWNVGKVEASQYRVWILTQGMHLRNTPYKRLPDISTGANSQTNVPDTLYCTKDMCPVKIHWHVKTNYQEYWRVKITITNRDFSRNFSQWTLTLQHPNFDNFTEAFSFNYKALNPYGTYSSKSYDITKKGSIVIFWLKIGGLWKPDHS